jgi:hypothetical protein
MEKCLSEKNESECRQLISAYEECMAKNKNNGTKPKPDESAALTTAATKSKR